MINNKYNIGDTVICIEWNEALKCFEVGKDVVLEIGISEEGVKYYGKEFLETKEGTLFTPEEALEYLKTKLEENDK